MMQDLTGMPAVGERIDTGSVALGLPEFVVLAAGEYAGEVELLVETTESVTGCPRCGVVATLHDRKPRWVRDLPVGGRPVVLVWFKRVWRCVEPACGQRTWSERTVAIRARSVLTERARVECARRVGQDATDVARVATDLGVGWGTVMRAVWEYGQKVLDGQWLHTNVTVLGLDETAFLKATAASSTQYLTGMVDLRPAGGGPARLLDVCPAAPGRWSPTGWTNAARTGAPGCRSPRWTRSAATSGRCAPGCRRPWCWMPSTPSGWPSARSTTSAAGSSRRPSGTAAASTTRCTGSAGCCCTGRRTSP